MNIDLMPEKVNITALKNDTYNIAFKCIWSDADTIENYIIKLELNGIEIVSAIEKLSEEIVVVTFPATTVSNDTYRVSATKNDKIYTWLYGMITIIG